MRQRTTWLWLLGGFFAVLLLPPLWVWLFHAAGVVFTSPQDPLALDTTLATVMGAIFVAGGLLVLLGSIISATNVERRVEEAVKQEGKIIRDNTYQQIDTFYKLAQARESLDWREAISSTEAILREQAVPQAGYLLGERLFRDIDALYRIEKRPDPPPPFMVRYSDADQLRSRAIAYLEEAIRQRQGPPGRASALRALLAGHQGDIKDVWKYLELQEGGKSTIGWQASLLREPIHVAMLSQACRTRSHLEALGNLLGMQLPVPMPHVLPRVSPTDGKLDDSYAWWVWAEPGKWGLPVQWFPRWFYLWTVEDNTDSAAPILFGRSIYGLTLGEPLKEPSDWDGSTPLSEESRRGLQFLCRVDEGS